jgi:hypothetical protein
MALRDWVRFALIRRLDARCLKRDTKLSASETDTGIPRQSPVSGDGDQILMNETPPFRGISSATRFRMR